MLWGPVSCWQVQKKERETYDQSTILVVYRVLFTELDANLTVWHGGDEKIGTDLIFKDGIPDVLCKFVHRTYIRIILFVPDGTGSLQKGLELVLGFFESAVIVITSALVCKA